MLLLNEAKKLNKYDSMKVMQRLLGYQNLLLAALLTGGATGQEDVVLERHLRGVLTTMVSQRLKGQLLAIYGKVMKTWVFWRANSEIDRGRRQRRLRKSPLHLHLNSQLSIVTIEWFLLTNLLLQKSSMWVSCPVL